MVICLERDADLHMAQLMPLPLTVSCFSKIQIGFTFLVPAYLGSPGKRAVKRVCVCVCYFTLLFTIYIRSAGRRRCRDCGSPGPASEADRRARLPRRGDREPGLYAGRHPAPRPVRHVSARARPLALQQETHLRVARLPVQRRVPDDPHCQRRTARSTTPPGMLRDTLSVLTRIRIRHGQWRHFSRTLGGLTFHTQLLLRVRYCNA